MTNSAINRIIDLVLTIKANEIRATVLSFSIVFCLMAAYFTLRPVRDAMASDWTDSEVSFLWNIQFIVSAMIVSGYGYLVTRIAFRFLVPLVYSIFAISFLSFYFLTPWFSDPTALEKVFYVWVSAFSLFHLSVFWSLMADTFTKEQGQRLFAIIAAGASAGALVGPLLPIILAHQLGLDMLMLIAAGMLMLVVPMIVYLGRLKTTRLGNHNDRKSTDALGGRWWQGFKDVVTNRYMAGIAVFILLYVFIGSFVYFEQKNLLAEYSRAERTQILGSIDWVVNVLTFTLAFFVTGRIVTKLGMPVALSLLPLALFVGMLVLAVAPLVIVVLAIQVARRAGNYAVTRPAREMLFTQVTAEQRFKAKPVIDTVIYRGGDAASGTLFALLSDGLGLGLAAIAFIGAGISAVWSTVAVRLGYHFQKHESSEHQSLSDSAIKSLSTTF